MRLGLVTDVHNDADNLKRALRIFRERGVDKVVALGDVCDAFSPGYGAAEVAALLDGCKAEGVWGNHDFNLCRDVSEFSRTRFSAATLESMSRMHPRLVIGNCHFTHRESSVDPMDASQLWDLDEHPPILAEKAALAFAANNHRWQFVGHYHQWWAATPEGTLGWTGERPLEIDERRHFIVIAAVCNGWCGILDVDRRVLEPVPCASPIHEA